MANPNLAELRTRGQRRADMENDDGLGSSEWNDLVNEAEDDMYDQLIALEYFVSPPQILSAASTALPSSPEHYMTLYVHRVEGGYYYPLEPLHLHNLAEMRFASGAPFSTHYRIEGGNIALYPAPPAGQTYEHRYAPTRTVLVADGDVSVIPRRWSEGTVLLASIAARTKDEASTTSLENRLKDFMERLKKAKHRRMLEAKRSPAYREPVLDSYFRRPYSRLW